MFAGRLMAGRVPSVRDIRAQLHVGQARAQRLRDYLAVGAARRVEVLLREQLGYRGTSQRPRLEGRLQRQNRLLGDLVTDAVS